MQEQDWGLNVVGGGGGNVSADEGIYYIQDDET